MKTFGEDYYFVGSQGVTGRGRRHVRTPIREKVSNTPKCTLAGGKLMDFKARAVDLIPRSLLPLVVVPFWFLHPNRDSVFFIPRGNSWYARKGDMKFSLPIVRSRRIITLTSERPYQRFYNPKRGEVVIDAGAAVGLDTIPMGRAVGEKGMVVVIEPEPLNIEYIQKNVETNNLKNVEVVQKGLWSEKGTAEFFVANKPTAHSMVKKEITGAEIVEKIKIQTDTLDNILSELGVGEVNLLKMDIQWAEVEALKGAEETLQATKNIIVGTHHDEERKFDTTREVGEALDSANFETRREGYYYFGKKE